ncbi:hypothetical protein C3492_10505 [Streptomyces sp. Ru62]|uniref:hypothetical protein n=1 Tax=Streptomyces sp. Ru62 TaxID=2080745 RepID=UPI000CDE0611|nr:hypothetical protein [Streptomyces sp. Ru62]POX63573.1 hypothetical protein C3492_10505 [Streptomyces sp. Ru62]
MRRISSTLTIFAAAGMLALTVPGSAFATNGFLRIGGVVHNNPLGCYEVAQLSTVLNFTDVPVRVHNVPGCQGNVVQIIPPGLATQVPGTHSILVKDPFSPLR